MPPRWTGWLAWVSVVLASLAIPTLYFGPGDPTGFSGGDTYTKLLSGFPVKSIGLTWASSQHRLEFVDRKSDHQVVPDDAAAHSTLTEKGQTAEHLSFREVRPVGQHSADAVSEPFVIRDDGRGPSYGSLPHEESVGAG